MINQKKKMTMKMMTIAAVVLLYSRQHANTLHQSKAILVVFLFSFVVIGIHSMWHETSLWLVLELRIENGELRMELKVMVVVSLSLR